jgi:hypothetical protein
MKPLSLYYSDEVKKWLREHAKDHRVVTQFQIASLFGKAYLKASTMTTAISGFRATGIWPVDANIFKEHDFLASAATDIDLNVSVTDQQNISNDELPIQPEVLTPIIQTNNSLPIIHIAISNPIGQQNNDSTLSLTQHSSPGCSHWSAGAEKSVKKSFFALSPEEIQPIPKSNKTAARISRRRGKTAILTESPYKNDLLAANILSATPRQVKRSLSFGKKKNSRTRKNLSKKTKTNEDDDKCLYCDEPYSTSVDGWIQCGQCKKWAHCLCAGIEEDFETMFNCEFCS